MKLQVDPVLIIAGIVLCLGGWIVFRIGSRLVGIALGLAFGFFFGQVLVLLLQTSQEAASLVLLGCSLLGAIGGFFLVPVATTLIFSLLGFLFGILLGRLIVMMFFFPEGETLQLTPQVLAVIGGTAAACAILAALLKKYFVMLLTSIIGATFLVAGIERIEENAAIIIALIALFSFLWQAAILRIATRSERQPLPQYEE